MRWLAIAAVVAAAACSNAAARSDDGVAGGGAAVLAKYCGTCHANGRSEGDFGFATDTAQLIAHKLIVPGDASASPVVRRIEDGEMPPEQVKARPSAPEIAALRAWIDGLASAAKPRPFVRDAEVSAILAADAARLRFDERASARWFTLVHLANASAGVAQLERTRLALAKLIASLTWSPSARAPVAVDPERLIYRIDLRELGWSAATWDAIRAPYPYGIARGAGAPDAIRADWFVATASRAPLYHAILGLPDHESELARRLGVDLASNIASSRVARAGFTGSGVSVNNRIIERHPTRHGALWRSFDFRSSVDRENIFAHPIDFTHAGGELIFNLPNGFQAYMLVDGAGRRLDKAPVSIVSDPRRPDRAVENAVSCMSCHSAGIIERTDELRDAVGGLDATTRDRVRDLHARPADMSALYKQDRARFAAALATLPTAGGGHAQPTDPGNEPISLVTLRFEAELDLHTAAAELGLTADELAARLVRTDTLRRTLGGLQSRGGTVKRDAWSAAFTRTLADTGTGIPFTPSGSFESSPFVWIDRAHRTWTFVGGRTDQPAAVDACRRARLELPRTDELVDAVAAGLSAGLRPDGRSLDAFDQALWTTGAKLDASNQRYATVVDLFTGTTRRADPAERHVVVCVQR
ncbi:MAG: hypothetical protein KF773_17730 [Deltaproteobacteria bacterium]|nr:hypothetical protein [Deltaproteobacteria bacterium]